MIALGWVGWGNWGLIGKRYGVSFGRDENDLDILKYKQLTTL